MSLTDIKKQNKKHRHELRRRAKQLQNKKINLRRKHIEHKNRAIYQQGKLEHDHKREAELEYVNKLMGDL